MFWHCTKITFLDDHNDNCSHFNTLALSNVYIGGILCAPLNQNSNFTLCRICSGLGGQGGVTDIMNGHLFISEN